MTEQINNTEKSALSRALLKATIAGAAVALFAISIFVFGVDEPNPEWGSNWRIKPLILTPLIGAFGGAGCFLMYYLSIRGWLNKSLAVILSIIGFTFSLWIGLVLGLNGIMWN